MRKVKLRVAIAFIAVAVAAAIVATHLLLKEKEGEEPTRIRLVPYGDAGRTITIIWESSSDESVVLYDTAPRGGNPSAYRFSAQGRRYLRPDGRGYVHVVELTGLTPNTTYYFVCGGEGEWSKEYAFKTAPENAARIRVIVGGDCRTNRVARDAVSRAMARYDPDLVVLTGDLVEDGDSMIQWEDFLNHINEYWVRSDGLLIPLVPCLGNHDMDRSGWSNFIMLFAVPNQGGWFHLRWGPVLIIVLNSEASDEALREQAVWLEKLLRTSDSLWKLVVFHRNVLPSHHRAFEKAFQAGWIDLFHRLKVDAVFNGHTHLYLRAKPLGWNGSDFVLREDYVKGILYVITGGWGAPLYEHPYPDAWVAGGLQERLPLRDSRLLSQRNTPPASYRR